MLDTIYLITEILGTIAFAISGTVVGINHKMDLFGILMMSVVTAVGGGIIRDILLGNIPPTALKSPMFMIISMITSIVTMLIAVLMRHRKNVFDILYAAKIYNITLNLSDAIGLGLFTVIGIDDGLSKGYSHNIFFLLILGMLTGVGGGMIRDVLSGQMPMVFRENIYAVSCLIGGGLYIFIRPEVGYYIAMFTAVVVIVLIRVVSYSKDLNLPRIKY